MAKVIDEKGIVEDDWVGFDRMRRLGDNCRLLLTVSDLEKYPAYFSRAQLELGLNFVADDDIAEFGSWIARAQLICLNFSAFVDGRAFSQARLLRERFAFRGDIRACGEVLRDQLEFMQRCGINQFALADDDDVEQALAAFSTISVSYQPELEPAMQQAVNG